MPLIHIGITDFRCIRNASLDIGPRYNLVVGGNASGKTSLLEAIAYLGRGRSFRGAPGSAVIRHGCSAFVVSGRVRRGERLRSIGVQVGKDGLEAQVDGNRDPGAAGLAEALPLQIVDPEVHKLVAGGPEERRRYLDWIGFHVEQGYLGIWRRFRRALRQRNAALREDAGQAELLSWDHEFSEAAVALDAARRGVIDVVASWIRQAGLSLLDGAVDAEYRRGWPGDRTLAEALAAAAQRDRLLGQTSAGPHRADLKLIYDERQARKLVSRGQQKLLACCLVLAATGAVQKAIEEPLLLLLDDPAAELDDASLERLMAGVEALDCQVIATALHADRRLFRDAPELFHVEQGAFRRGA